MPIEYRCPLCSNTLTTVNRTLKCENNHCFDQAKEGYVNLLPVQNKKSKEPGDSADMIQARRRFLEHGYYDDFAQALIATINEHNAFPSSLLDIGCGEGYYLAKCANHFSHANKHTDTPRAPAFEAHGIDISKAAVKTCAKKQKHSQFCVASAFSLPYFDASFDIALSVFSPIAISEAIRVLKPNGYLIFAGPAPMHLNELASIVYEKAVQHEGNPLDTKGTTAIELKRATVRKHIDVAGEHLIDLLHMTPYYWSCSQQAKESLTLRDSLPLTLDFDIQVFQKQA